MAFIDGFTWGVATASYQIEGAAFENDKGWSTWDMLSHKPGAIYQAHTGDVACDHFHRMPEDVALMQALRLGAYRFSISWPRVMPEGTGRISAEGLGFYDRLVDELLAAGIEPWPTLFHWDLPLDLYHKGGWLNPDMPKYFADYAKVVVDALGSRVQNWFTLNEPQCFVGLGMRDGVHAPGDRLRWAEVLLAAHHALIAHGLSTQVIRAGCSGARVGYAPVGTVYCPVSDAPEDVEAARNAMFSVTAKDQWQNSWWMDPVFLGHYPMDGLKLYGSEFPRFTDAEMETIHQPLDFFGANIYSATPVKASPGGFERVPFKPGHPQTAFRWWVIPECLYWGPKFFYERYQKPIIISENGLSNQDWVHLDGKVHDPQRIDFLRRHLQQLRRASEEGTPIEGYFHWSLMDNFEWAEGYKERFGLIYVDYETLERTPKDSYDWYRQVILTNGANL